MKTTSNNAFADEVKAGLNAPQKHLHSKYLYDAIGDKLFQKIMELPEYYLTRAEFAILDQYKGDILQPLISRKERFNLVELGAGDGSKTKLLLAHLYRHEIPFNYYPVDISGNVLQELKQELGREFPELPVYTIEDNYHNALMEKRWSADFPTLMLFLGSNLGNFLEAEVLDLLGLLSDALRPKEMLLAGFDLKKDPAVILNAYNDSQGVTRDFNLNLLQRINRELEADFNLEKFKHWPVYDPASGVCKSYLVSLEAQTVNIKALNEEIHFELAETIFTEVSMKYSLPELQNYAMAKDFEVVENFLDEKGYFSDSLWMKS